MKCMKCGGEVILSVKDTPFFTTHQLQVYECKVCDLCFFVFRDDINDKEV